MKNKIIPASIYVATLLVAGSAMSQSLEGSWLVRVRAVNISSSNTDNTGYGLSVNNKTIPEVDLSYFFNKNVALELVLTVPQEHTLYAGGTRLGTLEQTPPTLLVQYHFDAPGFKPYVGAGINYTQFSSIKVPGFDVDKSSFGLALQLGVDIPLARDLYLNLDVKKVYMGTDVYLANGANLGSFKIDPVLVGVGLGLRF